MGPCTEYTVRPGEPCRRCAFVRESETPCEQMVSGFVVSKGGRFKGGRATLKCGVRKAILGSRRALLFDYINYSRSKAGKPKKQLNTAIVKSCIKCFFERLLCVKKRPLNTFASCLV